MAAIWGMTSSSPNPDLGLHVHHRRYLSFDNLHYPFASFVYLIISQFLTTMSFMDEIRKIPPVTRTLCGSLLVVSLPVMLHIVSPYKIIFVKELVTKKFEVSCRP